MVTLPVPGRPGGGQVEVVSFTVPGQAVPQGSLWVEAGDRGGGR